MNRYQEKLEHIKSNHLTNFERVTSAGLFVVFISLMGLSFTSGIWGVALIASYFEGFHPVVPIGAAIVLGISLLIGCYFLLQQGLEHLTRFFSGLKKNEKSSLPKYPIALSKENPKAVIQQWIEKFNAGDAEGLAQMYAEDAINDQVVFSEPLKGRAAIQEMFELEFSRATMVCQEERIHVAGDWGILQWTDPLGLKGCGFFHIQNGLIVHQRGYFDQLTFFRIQGLDVPEDYLKG